MDLVQNTTEVPTRSTLVVWAEFIEMTGAAPERITELVEMGWLSPVRTAEEVLLFRQTDVYRLRKLERLCSDFELHTLGGSIVMDLLDRVAALELRIRELTRN
ncbi:MAG: chaperone modulator CbpM [Bilophila sp.]